MRAGLIETLTEALAAGKLSGLLHLVTHPAQVYAVLDEAEQVVRTIVLRSGAAGERGALCAASPLARLPDHGVGRRVRRQSLGPRCAIPGAANPVSARRPAPGRGRQTAHLQRHYASEARAEREEDGASPDGIQAGVGNLRIGRIDRWPAVRNVEHPTPKREPLEAEGIAPVDQQLVADPGGDPATGAPPVGGSTQRSCPGPDCGGPEHPTARRDVFRRLLENRESPAGRGDAGRIHRTELKMAGPGLDVAGQQPRFSS